MLSSHCLCQLWTKYSLTARERKGQRAGEAEKRELIVLDSASGLHGKGLPEMLIVVIQSLSHVRFFVTPWTAARQTCLSFTISWSLFKLMFIELVMPSNHLILWLACLKLNKTNEDVYE